MPVRNGSSATYGSTGDALNVRLSCEHCQRRKTKCDKNVPCAACQLARLSCIGVQRRRLPRGRAAVDKGRGAQLRTRITRLEALVKRLETSTSSLHLPQNGGGPQLSQNGCIRNPEDGSFTQELEHSDARLQKSHIIENTALSQVDLQTDSVLAKPFWTSLSEEVRGLKGILDEASDDSSEELQANDIADDSVVQPLLASGGILFERPQASLIFDEAFDVHDYASKLYDTFFDRVDPIFKLLHRPSLKVGLQSPQTETVAFGALRHAILYAAACSLTARECFLELGVDRQTLLSRLHHVAEKKLSEAQFLISTDITTLQAFILYVAALRACDSSRKSWTLLACAVRVAVAQGVDSSTSLGRTPFQSEMCRRAWYCIGILDIQLALDRGSEPILRCDDFPSLPLNIDDSDLFLADGPLVHRRDRFTDMTFPLLTYEAMDCHRRLIQKPLANLVSTYEAQQHYKDKFQCVADFERRVYQRYLRFCDPKQTLQAFTKLCVSGIVITMKLLIRRPLHRYGERILPEADDFDVLGVATEVLEHNVVKGTYTEFEKYHWFQWIKWFVLAIVLAELCGRRSGPSVDRAWTAVEAAYPIYARTIADSKYGALWKPIVRLMRKARAFRHGSQDRVEPQEQHGANEEAFRFMEGELWSEAQYAQFYDSGHQSEEYGTNQNSGSAMFGPASRQCNVVTTPYVLSEHADSSTTSPHGNVPSSWYNWEIFMEDIKTGPTMETTDLFKQRI